MKVFLRVASSLMLISLFTSCGQSSEDHKELAEKKINEAGEELKEAVVDANVEAKKKATEDWNEFKASSEQQIVVLENQSREVEDKISAAEKKEKYKLNAEWKKTMQKLKDQREKLTQRNTEFETDMKNFDDSMVTKNESFKREFKHDMDELGAAFKDLFKNTVK